MRRGNTAPHVRKKRFLTGRVASTWAGAEGATIVGAWLGRPVRAFGGGLVGRVLGTVGVGKILG